MNWFTTLYVAILFFVLTPGVLVRLPPKGGKFTVAAVHTVVFALIFHFGQKMVFFGGGEGFREGAGSADGYCRRNKNVPNNKTNCKVRDHTNVGECTSDHPNCNWYKSGAKNIPSE